MEKERHGYLCPDCCGIGKVLQTLDGLLPVVYQVSWNYQMAVYGFLEVPKRCHGCVEREDAELLEQKMKNTP